ncbi:MAG: hypothetical protein WCK57_08965 [Verrucomicrobiae bacterium]
METNDWLLVAVFIIGITALVGFFVTKTEGFGRFTTSTFLLLLVIIISALFYAADKLQSDVLANIIFAVIGFAGGLFTKKCSGSKDDQNKS